MATARIPVDRVFHALGNLSRLSIIERLSRGPADVSALADGLGITLAGVVQHLKILEESGLTRTEKKGRVRTCRIEPKGMALAEEWIASRRAVWERRYQRLGEMLEEDSPSE